MSPTLQNTRAQRNAALARSSSSTGHVVNVRYWHLTDNQTTPAFVRSWTTADKVEFWRGMFCLLLTQSRACRA